MHCWAYIEIARLNRYFAGAGDVGQAFTKEGKDGYLSFAFDSEYCFQQNFVSLHRSLIAERIDNLSLAKIQQIVAEKDLERATFTGGSDLFHVSLQTYFRLDGSRAEEDRVASALRGWGRSLLECGKLEKAKKQLQEM